MDGHLLLASFVVQSYVAIPPSSGILDNDTIWRLIEFGGSLLGMGVTVALPVGFALVLVQIVMGMLARAAPSLNLFAVGMPMAMMAGLSAEHQANFIAGSDTVGEQQSANAQDADAVVLGAAGAAAE